LTWVVDTQSKKKMGQKMGVLLEEPSKDEIALQIPASDLLITYQLLNKLNIYILATSQHVSTSHSFIFLWIHDPGSRIRNAVPSGLLGAEMKLVRKSKGERKICLSTPLTSYQLKGYVQKLEKSGIAVISHSTTFSSRTMIFF